MEEHKILTSFNHNDLSDTINQHLLLGWSTKGELKVTNINGMFHYTIMMIRSSIYEYEINKEFNTKPEMDEYVNNPNTQFNGSVNKHYYNGKWYVIVHRIITN